MDLGLSFGYHDSSAAVITNNQEIFSSHEERFSRIKFDKSFPENVIRWLAEIHDFGTLESVNYYEFPNLKTLRKLSTMFMKMPHSFTLANKIFSDRFETNNNVENLINKNMKLLIPNFQAAKVNFFRHHESHAACSFHLSPFEKAIIIVNDAVGEFDTSSIWLGKKSNVGNVSSMIKQSSLKFPDSLGLFYSMMTLYCGFKVNTGEYKLMGLAPYGNPVYKKLLMNNVIRIQSNGYVSLNREYLSFLKSSTMVDSKLEMLLKNNKRQPEANLTQFHADVAKSVQEILEDAIVLQVRSAREVYGELPICLSGGVALNAVANMKVCESIGEVNFFAPPASGDAGGALGAAILGKIKRNAEKQAQPHISTIGTTTLDLKGSKIGRQFTRSEVLGELERQNVRFTEHKIYEVIEIVANLLAEGKIVGWFFGPSEWGPRSLGARSILADPRTKYAQIDINKRIKFRESFRPFAPVVLEKSMQKYFSLNQSAPYMLRTVYVKDFFRNVLQDKIGLEPAVDTKDYYNQPISIKARVGEVSSVIPAVTHLDGTARVQTVGTSDSSFIYDLLEKFESHTGCGVLINTSFNVRGEPIVDSPKDALNCFFSTGLDVLCIEGFLVLKEENFEKINTRIFEDD